MRTIMRTVAIIFAVATAAAVDRKHKHHKHGAVAAPTKAEAAPTKANEAAPTKANEAAPTKANEAAPTKANEAAPTKANEAAPTKANEAAPTKAKEAAPTKAKEAAPAKEQADVAPASATGRLLVMGPLPTDFGAVFAHAVSQATACEEAAVHVIKTHVVNQAEVPEGNKSGATALLSVQAYDIVEVVFEAPEAVVKAVAEQAADPKSKLATGELAPFLTEKDPIKAEEKGVSFDTEMPYGQLEPFGREDTATELTRDSLKQSNAMVDQLEKAEVAEERRSVFRALTRLRGAAISSFDGIARSQTGNLDEYALTHQWRNTHPLHHLASEEGDVKTWAFPDAADLLQNKTN